MRVIDLSDPNIGSVEFAAEVRGETVTFGDVVPMVSFGGRWLEMEKVANEDGTYDATNVETGERFRLRVPEYGG